MTATTDFSVPVTIYVPRAMYQLIAGTARRHEVPVPALIVECLRRSLVAPAPAPKPRKPFVRRPWTDEDSADLTTLHAGGLSDGEIATILGRGQPTISGKRRELGLPRNFNAPELHS